MNTVKRLTIRRVTYLLASSSKSTRTGWLKHFFGTVLCVWCVSKFGMSFCRGSQSMLPGRKSDGDSMIKRSSRINRDYNMRDVILISTTRRSATVNIQDEGLRSQYTISPHAPAHLSQGCTFVLLESLRKMTPSLLESGIFLTVPHTMLHPSHHA